MSNPSGYILGQSADAARRLEVQDRHLAEPSEKLLDDLALRPNDRVVELGCGPGGMTRRIVRRLGPEGLVVAVDSSAGLQEQAAQLLAGSGLGRVEFVTADVSNLGPWLDGADVVIGRAVLHHIPIAEVTVGRLRARLKPGTRVGFIEPDFRSPVARIAYLEATGRADLAPLRVWATAINNLYLARRISPDVGASLAQALEYAGFRNVRSVRHEFQTDELVLENMIMFYDEVRGPLESYGILTAAEIAEQQRLLRAFPPGPQLAAWGLYRVACEV